MIPCLLLLILLHIGIMRTVTRRRGQVRHSENEVRMAGPETEDAPQRLVAYVVCVNAQCGYSEGFADLRDSPSSCPRCGRVLIRECGTCHMILRARSPICTNCGRPIVAAPRPTRPEPAR